MPDTMATLFSAGVTSVGCPARQRGLPAGREFIISCAPGWAGLESYLGKEKAGRNLFPDRSAFSLLPWGAYRPELEVVLAGAAFAFGMLT